MKPPVKGESPRYELLRSPCEHCGGGVLRSTPSKSDRIRIKSRMRGKNHVGYHYCSSVMYRMLLVRTAFELGISRIVCVASITTPGPSIASPTSRLPSKYTGVSLTRPRPSKYTLCLESIFSFETGRCSRLSSSEWTDSPRESNVFPIPRTFFCV